MYLPRHNCTVTGTHGVHYCGFPIAMKAWMGTGGYRAVGTTESYWETVKDGYVLIGNRQRQLARKELPRRYCAGIALSVRKHRKKRERNRLGRLRTGRDAGAVMELAVGEKTAQNIPFMGIFGEEGRDPSSTRVPRQK
ncbi:hypothetical protein Bca52824_058073 [Brassica carinata]|uniref:Uncharacterized protein n=1 Tax=Brassica carinata TaxID=52824 RepID=A0A8X7QTL2_BRACI|nr:hypothetical protein Bca52824_058073 [Brassica carinata]